MTESDIQDIVPLEGDYPTYVKIAAIAQAYQGSDHETIATRLQIDNQSIIAEWCKDTDLVQSALQTGAVDIAREQLKNKLVRNASIFVDLSLDPERLKKANLQQLMSAASSAIKAISDLEDKDKQNMNLNQININIGKSEDAIQVITQQEQSVQKKIRYLEDQLKYEGEFSELLA